MIDVRIRPQAIVPVTVNRLSIRFVLPVSAVVALLVVSAAQAAQSVVGHPRLIEVFTSAYSPVTDDAAVSQQRDYRDIELQIYEMDGIQRMETQLSKGLTADPEQAKLVALQRIQPLDEASRARMQRAATGLARAVQYGVDRYPAIVFDGKVVVYGVTDLNAALRSLPSMADRG